MSGSSADVGGLALHIFLIADIRGYTTFTQERGDEAAATLAMRFAAIARKTLTVQGGEGLQFRGDEVLAVFTSARQAIQAAVDLQAAFVAQSIADPSFAMPVGIGLDAGEAVQVDDGFRGGALNLAARLCSIAGPGEILASREVVHLARRVEGVAEADHGSFSLKGIADPVRVTRLSRDGWDPAQDDAFQQAIGGRRVRTRAEFAVCPYRGLAAFQPEDADRFFGRTELVEELVDRLDHDRVLSVIGPSGSGKSSLVRAGLIPAMRTGAAPASDRWAVALFTPRADPMTELSYQLSRLAETAVAADGVGVNPAPVQGSAVMRRLTDSICHATDGLLIVIDQFEELFTLSPRGEQELFIDALSAIADPAGSGVRLVMAIRADFYGVCATFPWLARRVPSNQVLVGPMSRPDLRKAIDQPALGAGLRLDEGLVDVVLDDAGTEAATLPLVSLAMAETWRRREGDTLTLAGYRDAGGVAGAISRSADSLFETALTPDEQEACRRLMLRLVTPGEGASDTRRRVEMRELQRDPDPGVLKVAADLTDARLLTVDRDSLEITHEALLQGWPRLRRWIDEARDDLRSRQRIGRAAAEWRAQDRDPDLLYRGTPLQASMEWAKEHGEVLEPQDEEFLTASRDAFLRAKARSDESAHRSRRLRRGAAAALAVLAAAALVASAIAFTALREARGRYVQALATQSRGLADTDPRTAIAIAAEASERGDTAPVDARVAMVDGSRALADTSFLPSGPPVSVGDASTVVVAQDGSFIVTGNRDGSISTWSAIGLNLASDVPGHSQAIEEMDITPDSRWLITGGDDGKILVWDLADPSQLPAPTTLGETDSIVWSVAVSPDGTTAASAQEDGTIRLWDLQTREQIEPVPADTGDAITVAFSPDGRLLLAGNGRGEVTGWSMDDRRVAIPTFRAHRSGVWEIEFDAQGSRFATASDDGRVRIWDTSSQELEAEPFSSSADDVRGVLMDGGDVLAGDEDGRILDAPIDGSRQPEDSPPRHAQIVDAALGAGTLATLGTDQRIQIWTRGDEPMAQVIEDRTGGAFALASSPDGTRLAIGDGEGEVRIVSTAGDQGPVPIRLHDGIVWDLAFSGDGTRVASIGEDGHVEVIDAATGEPLASPSDVGGAIDAVLWADDQLLTGGEDGVVRIWQEGGLVGQLEPHPGGVTAMALSRDGVLAVAGNVGLVQLWNLDDRERQGEPLAAGDDKIWELDWSPDGERLAAASDDGTVSLWEVGSRTAVGSLTPHPKGALAVAFLSDGVTIATTSRDGSVRLWDGATAQPLGGQLGGLAAPAWRVVPLPDMRFATSSEDGTVRIWDVLNPVRACERAAGPLGIDALGAYLGEGEEPVACLDG